MGGKTIRWICGGLTNIQILNLIFGNAFQILNLIFVSWKTVRWKTVRWIFGGVTNVQILNLIFGSTFQILNLIFGYSPTSRSLTSKSIISGCKTLFPLPHGDTVTPAPGRGQRKACCTITRITGPRSKLPHEYLRSWEATVRWWRKGTKGPLTTMLTTSTTIQSRIMTQNQKNQPLCVCPGAVGRRVLGDSYWDNLAQVVPPAPKANHAPGAPWLLQRTFNPPQRKQGSLARKSKHDAANTGPNYYPHQWTCAPSCSESTVDLDVFLVVSLFEYREPSLLSI